MGSNYEMLNLAISWALSSVTSLGEPVIITRSSTSQRTKRFSRKPSESDCTLVLRYKDVSDEARVNPNVNVHQAHN